MNHIYNALLPICKQLGLEKKLILQEIIDKWDIIFGSPMSNHTSPIDLKDGELTINVDSPAWLQQLRFMQPLIMEKLHDYSVNSVKLRLGRVKKGLKKDTPATYNEAGNYTYSISTYDSEWLNEILSGIKEPEIKDIIKKLILKSILHNPK